MEKFRLVIVNSRGYSLICEISCMRAEVELVQKVLSESKDIAVVRFDLIV